MSSQARATSGVLLIRKPSPRLAEGQITHISAPDSVDYDKALSEWTSYVHAFAALGWKTIEVDPAHDCPDSVFVEDSVVIFGRTAVVASPGHVSREPETQALKQWVLPELVQNGLLDNVCQIEKPGTLDGGDVLKIGKSVYVGHSSRTNQEGIEQLRHILAPLAYQVVAVPVTKALHLKSAVTALPDGTVIGWDPIVDDPNAFPSYLSVPEEHGVAVVVISQDHVLMSADAPKTKELFEKRGLQVTTVPISQFEALEGCVTCLSVRVRT
ncbi:dimethylarginine dimethylaminohydrolase [Testicularia cyperi]|uniref:Dimethylarginine dimethylaminohydrolase n=1 Tax=Testicularia cyperi TaxID=1882483 RepID=A0A317XYX0_9BASI|nr:dimethylarginine dimethylaminohydrolase [Testicularia cyperi]